MTNNRMQMKVIKDKLNLHGIDLTKTARKRPGTTILGKVYGIACSNNQHRKRLMC